MAAGGMIFLGLCLVLSALIIMSVRIYQVRPDFVFKVLRYSLLVIFWLIFGAISVAIGFRISDRHQSTYSRNSKAVIDIWGGNIYQSPPSLTYNDYEIQEVENKKTGELQKRRVLVNPNIGFHAQTLQIKIDKNVRQKGLLKFPGYDLLFSGEYKLKNTLKRTENLNFYFELPQNAGNITDIVVILDGKEYTEDTNLANGISWSKEMQAGEEATFLIKYKAQGTGYFSYTLGNVQKEIKNLLINIQTDFEDYIIPERAMVPTRQASDGKISKIEWSSKNLITGQSVALKFQLSDDYGSIAAKLYFYAPLSLFLFLFLILLVTVAREIKLHPMHYLFIIVSFFIFYLLGSYMISYIGVIQGIIASLAVSTGILLYYIYLIGKSAELLQTVAGSAIIFQWIFSVAFFFPEHTGFTITISTILSFIALMKITAKTNWENKF
ncbi:MAG: hypothetical protein H7A25_00625 [Leptospiraceae bacterium]|nr:hypothetical protein [Leptospiraceae bacterium]MCP5498381.1 hypothetical protein [Leptospiraceae bacterium]